MGREGAAGLVLLEGIYDIYVGVDKGFLLWLETWQDKVRIR